MQAVVPTPKFEDVVEAEPPRGPWLAVLMDHRGTPLAELTLKEPVPPALPVPGMRFVLRRAAPAPPSVAELTA